MIPSVSVSRLKAGLGFTQTRAVNYVNHCCPVMAAAELRRRMLPKLQRVHQPVSVSGHQCYSTHFLPYIHTDMNDGHKFRYLSAQRFNSLLKEIGQSIPSLIQYTDTGGGQRGFLPRHFRHVSLTMLHAVDAETFARHASTHMKSSKVFEGSYKLEPCASFMARFQSLATSRTKFADLSPIERLLV